MTIIDQIDESCAFIRSLMGDDVPEVGVILGSGLGPLADAIEDKVVVPYVEIPHFAHSTVVGHDGNLIIGSLGGKRVMAMQGRFHYYEGYSMQVVTFPVRVMARLGIKVLLISNAAGTMNPAFNVGDLMVITDHINMMPNPLIGPNEDLLGPRFPDMTTTYSPRLRDIAIQAADNVGDFLRMGVYVGVTGPWYETPAEYRMYHIMGGDAVGMSTVPEAIVARHSGMEVFGMSVITNQANALSEDNLNDGDDVVRAANSAAQRMSVLFAEMIAMI